MTSTSNPQSTELPRWVVISVFAVAFATRALWLLIDAGRTGNVNQLAFPDEHDYWQLASSLASGDGLVGEHGYRALRMPLYPGMLSLVAKLSHGVFIAKVVQCGIGALAAVFVARLTQQLAGPVAAVIAGVLVACDPFLVFFSSLLLTETLSITCVTALWLVGWNSGRPLAWRRWLAVGLLAALNIYARESSAGLVIGWIVFLFVRDGIGRRSAAGGGLALLTVIVLLLPWAMRNERVTGHWTMLTNRGGISLYDGVGPQATGASNLGDIKQMPAVRGLDEHEWNRYFVNASMDRITNDPVGVLRLIPVKLARTWNPMPNADGHTSWFKRAIGLVWNIPVYMLAIVAIRRWRSIGGAAVVAMLLPAAYITLLHSVFVGSLRYRLPAMPMIDVLAAILLADIIRRRVSPAPERA